jgi:hypothetical protein
MSRKYIGIYLKLEDNRKTINYMSIGQMIENKFNGIVYSYKGGGVYSDWYVYQDKYLPTFFSDEEAVDNDTAAQWLNHLVNDNNFVKSCYEKMSEYAVFEAEHLIKDDKLRQFENKNVYSHNMGISSKIVTEDDSAEYYEWDEFTFLFNWKSLIKDCLDHQITIDENGELSSSELVNEAISALMEDSVYCDLFSRDEVEKYITQIVEEIESRNGPGEESNLCNINIQECDICTSCNKVLLADDELYTKHNGDSLCAGCSFLCEGCNQYFTDDEVYFDKYGTEGCKKCIEKEQKALKEFNVYAIRSEEYHAKVAATTEEEAKQLAEEDYSNYDFVEVDGTLDTQIIGLENDEPKYLYQLERYDQWFSRDSLENFGVFTSKEKAIEAIKENVGPIDDGTENSFYWNGENQLISNDMGSFQFNKVELDCFGEC